MFPWLQLPSAHRDSEIYRVLPGFLSFGPYSSNSTRLPTGTSHGPTFPLAPPLPGLLLTSAAGTAMLTYPSQKPTRHTPSSFPAPHANKSPRAVKSPPWITWSVCVPAVTSKLCCHSHHPLKWPPCIQSCPLPLFHMVTTALLLKVWSEDWSGATKAKPIQK